MRCGAEGVTGDGGEDFDGQGGDPGRGDKAGNQDRTPWRRQYREHRQHGRGRHFTMTTFSAAEAGTPQLTLRGERQIPDVRRQGSRTAPDCDDRSLGRREDGQHPAYGRMAVHTDVKVPCRRRPLTIRFNVTHGRPEHQTTLLPRCWWKYRRMRAASATVGIIQYSMTTTAGRCAMRMMPSAATRSPGILSRMTKAITASGTRRPWQLHGQRRLRVCGVRGTAGERHTGK